ncbi:MAG: alpha/beta hydrolase [bacterium]|nr:alpha/beta hydrolase [bacterium]
MSDNIADINGAQIHYDITGEGQPLVLVHAGIADRRQWDEQVAAFAQHYRVIRYDARGYGQSKPVEGEYTRFDDLGALLDHLEIERTHLLGCSIGGTAVLDFALTYPDRAASLIVVCSRPSGFRKIVAPTPPKQWDEIVRLSDEGNLEAVSELEVQVWVDGPNRTPDRVAKLVRERVFEMNLIALRYEVMELGEEKPLDPPAVDRLSDIRIPTLLIYGEYDQPDVIQAGTYLQQQIPNARKVMLPAGHVPNMELPEEFNRLVLDFLAAL